jgi:hypothetical protein
MAGETGVIDYAGVQRPHDGIIEPVFGGALKAGYSKKQWLHADGSTYRGYLYPDGRLIGSCFVISAARQALLDADNAATASAAAQIATFRQSIRDLAQKVKDNTATAAEQRQLLVKLARVADSVLADL